MRRRCWLFLFLLFLSRAGFSQTVSSLPENEVRTALAQFIHAFENLDWKGFRAAFDDNATVFYPRAFPERPLGALNLRRRSRSSSSRSELERRCRPTCDIEPRGLTIQVLGDTAIATFHLDERAGFLNRRTIVLHKTTAGWKIIHLHASEVAVLARQ